MEKDNIHYCFTLSEDQLKFLRSKKYKIDRTECFMSLVELAERDTKLVSISKTQQVEILRGQLMIDNTQLANLWDKDRKTVPKIIEAMESLGISSSQKVGDNHIHTLHSLSGWYVDGHFVGNDYAIRRKPGTSTIIHADVPPARVITIEVSDVKNSGEEGSVSDGNNSDAGNVGVISPIDSNVSNSSPLSNESGNVGNSAADEQSSVSSHYDNSAHSDSTPPSYAEADGSQNEGKRKDETSAQQEVQPPQPDGIPSEGNGGYYQKSDGYNHSNGSHSDK